MKNIERAKEIFVSNCCSEFLLSIGNKDIMHEYESYDIDESIKNEWTREFLNERLVTMTNTNVVEKVSDMYLAGIHKYNDLIEEMCRIINSIYLDISNDERMMVLIRLDDIIRKSNIYIKRKIRKSMLNIIISIDISQLSYIKLLSYKRIKNHIKK